MTDKDCRKEARIDFKPNPISGNRRNIDRRREPGEGFTYVSTVGWICRREKCRRKDDPFEFDTNCTP